MLKSDVSAKKDELQSSLTEFQEVILKARSSMSECLVSNAAIVAVMQECPCITRCKLDIIKRKHNDDIDSLYSARHNLAKNVILEAIQKGFARSGNNIISEYDYGFGHLDIAIEENRIIITHQGMRIGVEIKSGTYVDAKHLYQIIRLLYGVDVLIFVRIPMEQVNVIYQQDIIQEIIQDISRIKYKLEKIVNKEEYITPGDCCKGCRVNCEFAKPSRFLNKSKPDLSDFAQFLKHLELTKIKVVQELGYVLDWK
jgi:hypothetical protein